MGLSVGRSHMAGHSRHAEKGRGPKVSGPARANVPGGDPAMAPSKTMTLTPYKVDPG